MNIELKQVSKVLGGVTVLGNISYTFNGGKVYGLRGKNGCGKTMLMRSVAGLMKPTSGNIMIDNKQLYKDMDVPDSIGILIENPSFLPEYTGYKNLKMIADIKKISGEGEVRKTLELVGLNPFDKRKVRKYSLGMRQRLGVAAAVMEKPDIILLDEPINAIDEEGVVQIRKLISSLVNERRIIIVACHDREELDMLADEVLLMENGRLV